MTLTAAQIAVLEAVREIGADGWPVSVREVQAKLGYASTQTVHRHLTVLEARGLLATNPRLPSRRGGWKAVQT